MDDKLPKNGEKTEMPSISKGKTGLAVFVTLSVLYFFSIFHRVGTASIATNLVTDFSTDNSVLGLMSGMYFYSYAAAQIPVGIMLDKIGTRKTLTILGLLASCGNLIFSLSPTIPVLALGRGLIGFGVGGFYVSALKALAVGYNPKRYATLTGVLTSIGHLGGVAASSPLALLTLFLNWREAFLIIFLLMFFFVVVAWFVTKNSDDNLIKGNIRIREDFRKIFSNSQLLKIASVPFFVYGAFVSFQGLWAGPFLMTVYEMSKANASLFFMFISIGFMVAFPLAGIISDKMNRKKPVLLTGIILSLIFWLVMSIFGGALESYQLLALLAFLGISYGITCIFLTIPATLFPLEISGSAIASLNIFNFIGGGFFQYLMGFIIDSTHQTGNEFFSYQIIFAICTLGIVFSLVTSLLFKENSRTEKETADNETAT
ncbi:MFS transporter [Candidatus Bathyarchaeota archaeon]|nr:MFS transporter [Candidatus Bathyarchaeota archaeon]